MHFMNFRVCQTGPFFTTVVCNIKVGTIFKQEKPNCIKNTLQVSTFLCTKVQWLELRCQSSVSYPTITVVLSFACARLTTRYKTRIHFHKFIPVFM